MARPKSRPPQEAEIPVPPPPVDEPVAVQEPPPAAAAPATRNSAMPGLVTGGALAAALGFAASLIALPQGWSPAPDPAPQIAAQTDRIAQLEVQVSQLNEALKAVPEDPRMAGLETAIADLKTRIEALPSGDPAAAAQLSQMESRLAVLEDMPVSGGGVSPAALAALQNQITALKQQPAGGGEEAAARIEAAAKAAEDRLAAALTEAETLQAEAQTVARQARVTALLGRVQAAVENGTPYAAALADLQAEGLTLPEALSGPAETGVPALRTLQDSFPEAARMALEASLRADPGEGWTDRLGTFLRSQTGARSLSPREGTDPDAVLSRAEAAVQSADLNLALQELAALPPEGTAALSEWTAQAQLRVAAEAALLALTGTNP